MSDNIFVDTNVLVYSRDLSEPEKQPQALAWMNHLWSTRTGRTGFQVLQEFYVTVTQKLVPGLDQESAREDVRSLLSWGPNDSGSTRRRGRVGHPGRLLAFVVGCPDRLCRKGGRVPLPSHRGPPGRSRPANSDGPEPVSNVPLGSVTR